MILKSIMIFSFLFFICNCSLIAQKENVSFYDTNIRVGAEFTDKYLPLLKNKRVAVVANQTTRIKSIHLVDSLLSLNILVKKVFSPEHGFRGMASAGEKVKSGIDVKTGLPIISLYGKNKKPTIEQLKDVDVVIFDIQDVGVRFYTYISTMHYVMEACAESNKDVIILDRPNPNGFYIDGPVLDKRFKSFVGMHPIPVVHGLTIGELAKMINGEKWLKNNIKCNLTVIKCGNYIHSDYYRLPVSPSPNLPNMASVYLYPTLCFFEGTDISIGRGTDLPFQIMGSPSIKKTSYSFTPKSKIGASNPKHKDILCNGYNVSTFGDFYVREIGELYLFWLDTIYNNYSKNQVFFSRPKFFDLLAGTDSLRKSFQKKIPLKQIKLSWEGDLNNYKKIRSKYLLYKDF